MRTLSSTPPRATHGATLQCLSKISEFGILIYKKLKELHFFFKDNDKLLMGIKMHYSTMSLLIPNSISQNALSHIHGGTLSWVYTPCQPQLHSELNCNQNVIYTYIHS